MNLNYKGLMNILGLQPWLDRIVTLENIINNLPSGSADGNGVYDGGGTIPQGTLMQVTPDLTGSEMDFAIGNFPIWPNLSFSPSGNESGFYYGDKYWGGSGIIYNNSDGFGGAVIEAGSGKATISGFNATNTANSYIEAVGRGGPLGDGRITISTTAPTHNSFFSIRAGTVNPNGAVTGTKGDIYINTNGGAGTVFYIKESGAGTNTGWVAK